MNISSCNSTSFLTVKSAWPRSNFSLAVFVPPLMLAWPCGVSLQGAQPGHNSCCREELNSCWAALHFRWSVLLAILVCIPSHPQGMGGKCHFHGVLEWCQEYHLLLSLLLSLFFFSDLQETYLKCSIIHEVHFCVWVLFILKWCSSSRIDSFRVLQLCLCWWERCHSRKSDAASNLPYRQQALGRGMWVLGWILLHWRRGYVVHDPSHSCC